MTLKLFWRETSLRAPVVDWGVFRPNGMYQRCSNMHHIMTWACGCCPWQTFKVLEHASYDMTTWLLSLADIQNARTWQAIFGVWIKDVIYETRD
jgi:hypothetical protein